MDKELEKLIEKYNISVSSSESEDYIDTGNYALNYIISGKFNGGYPVGKIIEIYGESSVGKSLLGYLALVNTQKRNGRAILIDTEYSFTPSWYSKLGGKTEDIIVFRPESVEISYEFIEEIVKEIRKKDNNVLITIVYDSIAALATESELEANFGKSDYGKRAQIHSKSLRKILSTLNNNRVTFIAINQVRYTMCVDPETKIYLRYG